MLGHRDETMTPNVYTSLFEDDVDLVSDRLVTMISEATVCQVPVPP